MLRKTEKYYYTLKYLKKSQWKYLIKNRLERGEKAVTSADAPPCGHLHLWMPRLDTHPDYLKRFDVEEILEGKVTLLHESGISGGKNWANPEKSHLWNFNLHYLEFLIPLAAAYQNQQDEKFYDRFRKYCRLWIADNREGSGDGWHPYTISLRLTNLWICMDAFEEILKSDTEFFRELNNSMYAQYLHLQKKLELHLLGNHYFENVKAVMLGALYFKEPGVYDKYKHRFLDEIEEQILPDGLHYERSLMYHKIILEDVMRAAKALQSVDQWLYQELLTVIQRMADAMYSLEEGMGHTPLFNDAGDNVARSMLSLLAALQDEFQIVPQVKQEFSNAGYYWLCENQLKILMDAGDIAPDYMPGHGHCDGLSFELSWKGQPLFVNAGTGQYQGELRSYFRSTAAHNTVVIDGEEQSQCWGEHRVAKRISRVSGGINGNEIYGELTTCHGKKQERSIRLQDQIVEILDRVQGTARAYFHLAPEFGYEQQGKMVLVKNSEGEVICEMQVMSDDQITIFRDGKICSYAPEFGMLMKAEVLEVAWDKMETEHKIQMIFQ